MRSSSRRCAAMAAGSSSCMDGGVGSSSIKMAASIAIVRGAHAGAVAVVPINCNHNGNT